MSDDRWNYGHPGPPPPPVQFDLPDERPSVTRKFRLVGHRIYVTVGLYANGQPGELFVVVSKPGTIMRGMDSWARGISKQLQTGVPLASIVAKHRDDAYEPNGYVEEFGFVKSIHSLVVRWMERRFLTPQPEKPPKGALSA